MGGLGYGFFTGAGSGGLAVGGAGPGFCQGSITLRTLSDVAELASRNCETLDGSLGVTYQVDNLDALAPSTLRTITGSLSIGQTSNLKSLAGLSGLRRIGGSLSVGSNELLENLSGLESLEQIGSDPNVDSITIQANPKLTSFDAIGSARITAGVMIMASEALTSVAGLKGLSQSGSLWISGAPSLKEIRLDALTECAECKITSLLKLQRLELPSLKRAQVLRVASNLRLQTLSLPLLQSVERELSVIVNDALTSVGTLEQLSSVGVMQFAENPKLPQCFVDALGARLNACQIRCGSNDEKATCP